MSASARQFLPRIASTRTRPSVYSFVDVAQSVRRELELPGLRVDVRRGLMRLNRWKTSPLHTRSTANHLVERWLDALTMLLSHQQADSRYSSLSLALETRAPEMGQDTVPLTHTHTMATLLLAETQKW